MGRWSSVVDALSDCYFGDARPPLTVARCVHLEAKCVNLPAGETCSERAPRVWTIGQGADMYHCCTDRYCGQALRVDVSRPQSIAIGSTVRFIELTGRAELNDYRGTVTGWDADAMRWRVKVGIGIGGEFRQPPKSNETVRVKPENVRLLHSAVAEQRMSLIVNFMKGDFATPGSAEKFGRQTPYTFDSGESVMKLRQSAFDSLPDIPTSRLKAALQRVGENELMPIEYSTRDRAFLLFGFNASRLKLRDLFVDECRLNFYFSTATNTLFVKLLTGRTFTLKVDPSDKINTSVIEQVEKKEGIATRHLVFAGQELDPGRTLYSYNIQTESTIHLLQ